MMSAKLVRAGNMSIGGFRVGSIEHSIASQLVWASISIENCRARPAVYVVWADLAPRDFHVRGRDSKMATKRIAPKEDQGVIFGIINRAGERNHRRYDSLCRRGWKSFRISRNPLSHFKSHSRAAGLVEWS